MDRIRLGLSFRALRVRRGWRQIDVAQRAGLSQASISSIERGGGATRSLATLVRVADVLEARVDVRLLWHGEQLDRLLDSAHARLVEDVVALLGAHGWEVAVEVSFAIRGERGSIDVLARHRATGALLVTEVKSVVPDNQAMLYALDRKVRLAPQIGAQRGWTVAGPVSRLLVVAEGSTGRRRIAALAATYASVLPHRGAATRRWIRTPVGPLRGLLFLPFSTGSAVRATVTGVQRVRGPRRRAIRPELSSSISAGAG